VCKIVTNLVQNLKIVNNYWIIFLLSLGFNCGEAVNFAIGDWFPLGAAASERYSHLKMLPIIPYEELLCKEALLIYNSSKDSGFKIKPKDTSYRAIVLSFLHLIQFYKTSLSRFDSSIKLSSYSNTSLASVTCSLCSRDCYVAFLLCKKCYSDPICLFHGKTSLFYLTISEIVI